MHALAFFSPFVYTVLATKLAEINLAPLTVFLNGLEAASTYQGTRDAKEFQVTYQRETLFKLATIATNYWSFGLLVHELGKKHSFVHINFSWKEFRNLFQQRYWLYQHPVWKEHDQFIFGTYACAAAAATVITLVAAVKIINIIHAYYQPQVLVDPNKQPVLAKEVKIYWERPFIQNLALFLNVAKLSMNVALAILSSSRSYFVLNAALIAYTLYQVTKRKWLCVSRTREWETHLGNEHIKKVEYVYRCFLMPFSSKNVPTVPKCQSCSGNEPNVNFHGDHVFHARCLITNIVLQIADINVHKFTRHESRDNRGRKEIDYDCDLGASKMPSCPKCPESPFHNDFEIFVHEKYGRYSTTIHWKKGELCTQ